ncbi:MAG: 3-dehydroquinate synthase [Flavobacteriales bacterium]
MSISTLSDLSQIIEDLQPSKVIILVDSNTHEHCLAELIVQQDLLSGSEVLEVPPGEETKSLEIAAELWSGLNEIGADRSSLLINLGGGMITDLGGFVASTFRRGMTFINIPTTLLAMVDAAIGGKTGINLGPLKNHIGTFQNPETTVIDPIFLGTLTPQHLLSGFAEMVKHALIRDPKAWDSMKLIDTPNLEALAPWISSMAQIKLDIVASDPFEKSIRKSLNFGHTIGHAIESLSITSEQAPLEHGEAIGLGMIYELRLACAMGLMNHSTFDEIEPVLTKWYSHFTHNNNLDDWWPLMLKDKKNIGDNVNMTLLSEVGTCHIDQIITREQLDLINE